MEEVDGAVVGAAPCRDQAALPRAECDGFDGGGVWPTVAFAARGYDQGGAMSLWILAEGAEVFPGWSVVVVGATVLGVRVGV